MIDLKAIQRSVVTEYMADASFKPFDDKEGEGIPLLVVPEEYSENDFPELARLRVTFPSVITTGVGIWEARVLLSFTYQVKRGNQYQAAEFMQKVINRANHLPCMKLEEMNNPAAGFIDEAETIYAIRVDCTLNWQS